MHDSHMTCVKEDGDELCPARFLTLLMRREERSGQTTLCHQDKGFSKALQMMLVMTKVKPLI